MTDTGKKLLLMSLAPEMANLLREMDAAQIDLVECPYCRNDKFHAGSCVVMRSRNLLKQLEGV